MTKLMEEFKCEVRILVKDLEDCLDRAERGNLGALEEFGQKADRIMGGAKSLALMVGDGAVVPQLGQIGIYCELCKLVGYKGSQVREAQLSVVVVAFLQDATELLQEMVERLGGEWNIKEFLQATFLDRLKWLSKKFDEGLRGTVAVEGVKDSGERLSQERIDELLTELQVI